MAIIKAVVNNGNWSNTSTWSPATVPTIVDDVVANGVTVVIDGTQFANSLRNDTTGSSTTGGTFYLANGSNMTAGFLLQGITTTPVVQVGLTANQSATLNSSATGGANIAGTRIIQYNGGGGTFNLTGNYSMSSTANTSRNLILLQGSGFFNFNGILGSTMTNQGNTLLIQSALTCDITAIITSPPVLSTATATINISAGGTVKITGNITASIGYPLIMNGGDLTVIGNVTGSASTPAILNNTTATSIDITGAVTAGAGGAGVSSLSSVKVEGPVTVPSLGTVSAITTTGAVDITGNVTTNGSATAITAGGTAVVTGNVITNGTNVGLSCAGLATIDGLIFNNQQWQGVYAPRILIGPATSVIRYQTFSGTTQLMWSGSPTTLGLPTPNDVRFGVPFGVGDVFTGTCKIPAPEAVLIGVPVGTTVGTLVMSPAAVVAELGTSTLDIAVRLQNVATVQTTGEQAATYFI
jgi:hypothetical protein